MSFGGDTPGPAKLGKLNESQAHLVPKAQDALDTIPILLDLSINPGPHSAEDTLGQQ